jgi:hypothetical protein
LNPILARAFNVGIQLIADKQNLILLKTASRESEVKESAVRFSVAGINGCDHPFEMVVDVPSTKPASYAGFGCSPRVRPYPLACHDTWQHLERPGHQANGSGAQRHFAVTELIHYGMSKIKDYGFYHLSGPDHQTQVIIPSLIIA